MATVAAATTTAAATVRVRTRMLVSLLPVSHQARRHLVNDVHYGSPYRAVILLGSLLEPHGWNESREKSGKPGGGRT